MIDLTCKLDNFMFVLEEHPSLTFAVKVVTGEGWVTKCFDAVGSDI